MLLLLRLSNPPPLPPTHTQSFAAISDQIRSDMYLYPHFKYYVREIRVLAYAQVRKVPPDLLLLLLLLLLLTCT